MSDHLPRVTRVDAEGIALEGGDDRALDYRFDGRRIGSFWSGRDTEDDAAGGRLFPWPTPLRRFLDGHTELSVVDHVTGTVLHDETVRFGDGQEQVKVQDAKGNDLGFDKSQRLMRLFSSRSAEHVEPLLDSISSVVEALEACGIEPFLAYGTLLGAVRQQALIGHDSDADLGYVSRFDHPVDATLESFQLQRRLVEMGYAVARYSGLAFKIWVEESDGAMRGLDVFGGLMRDGRLYLMGEVGHPFRPEWVHPRSEVTLEGRTFPAPADPAPLLEAMYGPSWEVPDPAYKFETPESTRRRLNGWFRGTRVHREDTWGPHWNRPATARAKLPGPSSLVQWVREQEPGAGMVVDVGCGRGGDVVWLARQGTRAWGLDFVPRAYAKAARRADQLGVPAHFQWGNLSELRSVLAAGAQLVREDGPRIMMARHVVDATNAAGRDHLLRLARMVTRDSGRLYLDVTTGPAPEGHQTGVHRVRLAPLLAHVERLGGRVESQAEVPGDGAAVTRLVVSWSSRAARTGSQKVNER